MTYLTEGRCLSLLSYIELDKMSEVGMTYLNGGEIRVVTNIIKAFIGGLEKGMSEVGMTY